MRWSTKVPCTSCPYRMDTPLGTWSADHFVKLLIDDADPINGTIYGCHSTSNGKNGPAVCGGWLLDQKRRGAPSIQLRLALLRNKAAAVALERISSGGHQMFESLGAMCRENLLAILTNFGWRPTEKKPK